MDAKEKITKARAGLILDAPFFGSIALKHRLKEDATCATAWINGREIGYNPQWIESLPLDHVKGVLAHEVMHIAAAHHARRQNRDPKKWNAAGDHAINQILNDAGFTLPPEALPGIPEAAEAIYARMPDSPPDDGNGQQDQQGQGQGQGGNPAPGQGNDPGGCGEVRDFPGDDDQPATPAELAQAEAEAKITVAQAAQQAKAMGKMPGSLKRLIEEILQPKVDWSDVLRRFIEQSAKNDYSWTRPNRRHLHAGLYLPGLHSNEIGNVVIAVDTSGSVSARDLAEFAAEVSGVLEAYDTTTTIIYADSRVRHTEEFTRQDLPLDLRPRGGGGTRYAPAFAWIDEHAETPPACMVYLTDGECSSFPEHAPEYPVLWTITDGGAARFRPPFGEVIGIQ